MQDNLSNVEPIGQDEGIDFREYLALFWQWLWLITLIAVLVGAAAFFYFSRQTPIYQATTRVQINIAPGTMTTDYSSVVLSEQLTSTFALTILSDPVMEGARDSLHLSYSPRQLAAMVKASPVNNTALMDVTVESDNPKLAADLANTVVDVFGEWIKTNQSNRFTQSKNTLETQMANVESQISAYSTQEAALPTQQAGRDALDSKIAQYRGIYSGYLQSYETIRLAEAQTVSSISKIQPATVPNNPVRPNPMQSALLAAMVGFALATSGVFAREILDDTLKTPEDVVRYVGVPVLSIIHHHDPAKGKPITESSPRSPVSEGFRKLRTNIQYASIDHGLHTILITSPEPGEGKTTIAANLAVVFAHNDRKVVLFDCDLRRPAVHHIFDMPNKRGLSDLFINDQTKLSDVEQESGIKQLRVVTSGSLPPNPAELLESDRMQAIISETLQTCDILVIDTPPALAVTDASVLASSVDGVVLVFKPGSTRRTVARQAVQQLLRSNARLLGVVLNNLDLGRAGYGYRYYYHKYYPTYNKYYVSEDGTRSRKTKKSKSSKAEEPNL